MDTFGVMGRFTQLLGEFNRAEVMGNSVKLLYITWIIQSYTIFQHFNYYTYQHYTGSLG